MCLNLKKNIKKNNKALAYQAWEAKFEFRNSHEKIGTVMPQ